MFLDVIELILNSAEKAFLEVGAFVGGMLLLFNLINFRTKGGFVRALERSRSWQPLFGALLGLTPGCGGALFVMPLFMRGMVSFGTVTATLISTAGDSAFVLIAASPMYALITYSICFVVAVISGYLVDAFKIGTDLGKISKRFERAVDQHEDIEAALEMPEGAANEVVLSRQLEHIGHEEGDAVDMAMHHGDRLQKITLGHRITHHAHMAYWIFIAAGLVMGVMLLAQVEVNEVLQLPVFGVGAGLIVGTIGIVFSIVLMVSGKSFLGDDTFEASEHKLYSLRETLVHSAGETAFATSWVFVAFLAYELIVFGIGGGDYDVGESKLEQVMLAAGLLSVIVGAAMGLIPGCGPQIVFVALFARGMIPFSALVANAISQDGDALFPLIVMNRRSAFWATIATTIPAIIFGVLLYYSGIDGWLAAILPIGGS